ncbi:hypothetical protein BN1723_018543, partial [Verticillium longisporum]
MAAASQAREQAMFGFKALNASALIDIHLRGDELTHQSTLTLIYRAIPAPEGSPSRFTQECIETARFAMQIHHDGKDVKTLLFWHTYMLDKSLALRTGRSSAIQDWDITLPRTVDSTMVEDPWGAIITTWIRESEMHHRVYEHLYSPTALA